MMVFLQNNMCICWQKSCISS